MSTKEKVFEYIKKNGPVKPGDILDAGFTGEQMLYRHLKSLLNDKIIEKRGSGPHVFYVLTENQDKKVRKILLKKNNKIIEDNFYLISPTGKKMEGVAGFEQWCNERSFNVLQKSREFKKVYKKYKEIKKNGLFDATYKIKKTFKKDVCVDKLFYNSFYSVEIFGKTKMGQKILYAKQGQNRRVIKEIAQEIENDLKKLIRREKIEAVIFVPPTVPRKVQFMKVLEKNLDLRLPRIDVRKIFDEIRVPQKTLRKLEDRIENAKTSFQVEDSTNLKNILIIDDAVGSGASINQIACKIRKQKEVKKIIGFSVTGSLNNFDVISEV